jgi:hypothetical protein
VAEEHDMNWQGASVGVTIIGLGIASWGCTTGTVPDGAQSIFSRATTCPPDRVVVTARPDVAPHTVLRPASDANMPTPDATDPDQSTLKPSLSPRSPPVSVDEVGTTYQVFGCGRSATIVCANPVVDGRSGPFSASFAEGFAVPHAAWQHDFSRAQIIDGDRVVSMVVCEPANRRRPR